MSYIRRILWFRVIAVAIPAGLLVLGSVWLLVGRRIPDYRVIIYDTPISNVQSIRIVPGNVLPIVDHEIVISDTKTLQEILGSIRSARTYSPNHPASKWTCILIISSPSGEGYVEVNDTVGQSAILYCKTARNGGIIFETLQSDKLGQILEVAVRNQQAR